MFRGDGVERKASDDKRYRVKRERGMERPSVEVSNGWLEAGGGQHGG